MCGTGARRLRRKEVAAQPEPSTNSRRWCGDAAVANSGGGAEGGGEGSLAGVWKEERVIQPAATPLKARSIATRI